MMQATLAEAMAEHLLRGDWGRRSFNLANRHLDWIQAVLSQLAVIGRLDLFEDVASSYVQAVESWNRFSHNDRLGRWLIQLPEDAGVAFTRAIRQADVRPFFRGNFGILNLASPTLAAFLSD